KAPVRPASPQSLQAAQTQSKGQSQSAPMKQQKQPQRSALPLVKQQQNNNKNAQVYRPSPVQEHPDDAFLSGAWMFDAQRVPQWLASQLPTAKRMLCSPKPGQQSSSFSSQSQQPTKQQQQQQQMKQQPIQMQPNKSKQQQQLSGHITTMNCRDLKAYGCW
ncbi:hypothetical protein BC828DRAFT_409745, partial [Blastocladiella britannica]